MYQFVGMEGEVLPVCPSVSASLLSNSVSDHKKPLIGISKRISCFCNLISMSYILLILLPRVIAFINFCVSLRDFIMSTKNKNMYFPHFNANCSILTVRHSSSPFDIISEDCSISEYIYN